VAVLLDENEGETRTRLGPAHLQWWTRIALVEPPVRRRQQFADVAKEILIRISDSPREPVRVHRRRVGETPVSNSLLDEPRQLQESGPTDRRSSGIEVASLVENRLELFEMGVLRRLVRIPSAAPRQLEPRVSAVFWRLSCEPRGPWSRPALDVFALRNDDHTMICARGLGEQDTGPTVRHSPFLRSPAVAVELNVELDRQLAVRVLRDDRHLAPG